MKFLIIRLSAIGDTIHCLPSAAAIKERIPGATVAWMVEPPSAPLLQGNPVVDEVWVLPRKAWLGALSSPWRWRGAFTEIGAFWSGVRSRGFDVALDFQGLLKSALCALGSGAAMRFGFANTREGAQRLMTDTLDVGDYFAPDRHMVDLNLELVDFACRKLGITGGEAAAAAPGAPHRTLSFPLPDPPPASAEKIRGKLATAPGAADGAARNAVFIPGTTWSSKIWPAESWCQLGGLIGAKMGMRLILVGGPAEAEGNARIAALIHQQFPDVRLLDLTEQTSLLELIPLFRSVDLVVGSDTGPLHLAAAVAGPPVIGIYGSTPWRRNGPYGPQCLSVSLDLWCQPCFKRVCPLSTVACLKELTAEAVYGRIEDHLSRRML